MYLVPGAASAGTVTSTFSAQLHTGTVRPTTVFPATSRVGAARVRGVEKVRPAARHRQRERIVGRRLDPKTSESGSLVSDTQ